MTHRLIISFITVLSLNFNTSFSQDKEVKSRMNKELYNARLVRDSILRPRNLTDALRKTTLKTSGTEGKWVYNPKVGKIQKLVKPRLNAIISNWEFYQIPLTNYLGYHVNQANCLIMYDPSNSDLLLVEPLWYTGIGKPLLQYLLGKKFSNKDSLMKTLQEINDLLEIGSTFKFQLSSYSDSLITYDLVYSKGDKVTTETEFSSSTVRYNERVTWRKVYVYLKNFAIIKYVSLNPKTGDEEFIE